MSYHAFQLSGHGRLVVCKSHATDVWMWLWMEAEMAWSVAGSRGNDRQCAVCTPEERCPEALDAALERQGRPRSRIYLKRAA